MLGPTQANGKQRGLCYHRAMSSSDREPAYRPATATHDSSRVSVIVTVLNEADSLARLLASLADQTRVPDEVVIVDGGSTDGTLELLATWARRDEMPLVVVERPGANISRGRNVAIEAAAGPIIASTDAGVRLVAEWLERLVIPIVRGEARVASGFFASDPQGAFETALGATTLPEARDVDPATFLPSSRSIAFLKQDWSRCGGYPEWLDYCEDLVFDLRLLTVAGPAAFARGAVARFRPRSSAGAFVKQYYRYARGDGKADLWRRRHAIRYLTYGIALPTLLALGARVHPLWWLILAVSVVGYLWKPARRLMHQWGGLSRWERVKAMAWVPAIRLLGDLAKMAGYPVGWRWRLRERPPRWRPSFQPVTRPTSGR